jgi:hypothetical protein
VDLTTSLGRRDAVFQAARGAAQVALGHLAGTLGWRYGPTISGLERKRLVASFNGGFRLSVGAGGFESYGRTGVPLSDGLGSIVTYTDGTTDIGRWHHEVPAPGKTVASVRKNLTLLIDHGTAAATLDCRSCWGATLGGVIDPARSALGIQPDGHQWILNAGSVDFSIRSGPIGAPSSSTRAAFSGWLGCALGVGNGFVSPRRVAPEPELWSD